MILACPKCHEPLISGASGYDCVNHHHYDKARLGYVNLLLNQDKATNEPGDSKESLIARREFLNRGYYEPLSDTLNEIIASLFSEKIRLLDLGCGIGYYLNRYGQFKSDELYGVDISKQAIAMACKLNREITWLVANMKNLPFQDHSLDCVTALFTVVNAGELRRVVKKGGYVIHVTANNAGHLRELKELLYGEVYAKDDRYLLLPFDTVEIRDVRFLLNIENQKDALNLVKMTPHYYHIKKERREILDHLAPLRTTVDVRFHIYAL